MLPGVKIISTLMKSNVDWSNPSLPYSNWSSLIAVLFLRIDSSNIESVGKMVDNDDSYWCDHPINDRDDPEYPTFEQIDSLPSLQKKHLLSLQRKLTPN